MSSITPISIPDGAGIDYAGGDVRHIATHDGLSVPAVAAPTRHLAYRDRLLAEKLNEVVAAVNQREQLVNLPTFRTVLPPSGSVVVSNYRVPPGFEARILNAAVATTPPNLGQLDIYHNESFGSTTGTSLVTTLSEFPGATDAPSGTDFRSTGEFVVKITNTGSSTVEAVASVIVTMRATGDTGALIAAGSAAARGARGLTGPAGLVWRNSWQNGTSYVANDGVYSATSGNSYICRAPTSSVNPDSDAGGELDGVGTYWCMLAKAGAGAPINGVDGKDGMVWRGLWSASYGTYNDSTVVGADVVSRNGSSYVCKLTHAADSGKEPGTAGGTTYWDMMAQAGSDGNTADSVTYKGVWNSIDTFDRGDMVTHVSAPGAAPRTWVANSAVAVNLEPGVSGLWDELFGPSPTLPVVSSVSANGSVSNGGSYTAGAADSGYLGLSLSSPVDFAFAQKKIDMQHSGMVYATLTATGRLVFKGTARFKLPSPAAGVLGAGKPWDASNTVLFAALHGKTMVETDQCKLVTVTTGVDVDTTYFDVTVNSAIAEKVQISVYGSEVKVS